MAETQKSTSTKTTKWIEIVKNIGESFDALVEFANEVYQYKLIAADGDAVTAYYELADYRNVDQNDMVDGDGDVIWQARRIAYGVVRGGTITTMTDSELWQKD